MNADQGVETPRAAARRKQVLDAASICFRRYGFHAASMAQVAAEAAMSVGHIYRYFAGKEQIIAAIVQQDIDRLSAMLNKMDTEQGDRLATFIKLVEQGVADATDPERASLRIEIRAEAARNPQIRKMLSKLDHTIEQCVGTIIRKMTDTALDETDLSARVEMFALIFHGIALKTVVNADIDRVALTRLIGLVMDAILR